LEKAMVMENAEFEKRFLALVNQTDTVITAPNIAYHLSIPIEEAQEHLLSLELNGTLQQSTDTQGNPYYQMPSRLATGTLPSGGNLQTEARAGNPSPPGVYNPAALPSVPIYSSPPAKGKNVNGMILNVIFPGLGSLVCGKMIGLAMMALLLLGFILFFLPIGFFGRLLGIVPIAIAWIWSIVAGVALLGEKEPGPGIPS
jgi:hypothetical protein